MFKNIYTILISLLLIAGMVSGSEPVAILVVGQDDNKEYEEAQESFIKALEGSDVSIRAITIAEIDNNAVINYLDYDLYVVIGSRAALKVKSKVPRGAAVAYCMVYSPEDLGLTAEEKNFGVSLRVSVKEQISLIQKVVPNVRTIATMADRDQYDNRKWPMNYWPDNAGYPTVIVPEVIENHQRAGYVGKLLGMNPDCIWIYPDSNVFHSITVRLVLLESIKRRIPVFGYSENVVKAGALLGVSVAPSEQGKQLAEMVIKYNSDNNLSDRHETARFSPVFNLAVAEIVNIKIPQDLLSQAIYVYGK